MLSAPAQGRVLLVDDDPTTLMLLRTILTRGGLAVETATDGAKALERLRELTAAAFDVVLTDYRMPILDGLQLLEIVKEQNPTLPVVMISGHGNIETAVSAIRLGAYDFIEKPFKADRLVLVAERALETSRLKREVSDLRARAGAADRIIGHSSTINQLRQVIDRVGPANSRILITGASGSGKELTARAIHAASNRSTGPFVVINAATITPDSMETELFGTEGTDGRTRKVGALEEAHGGTLYLDEVADMPKETQGKILRVLVDQNFQRVGGATRVHVDVRIISSTSRDLQALIAESLFREDLFHRLSVVPIRVPTLSERREDISELVTYFMDQISTTTGLPRRKIGEDAMAILQSHDWPGNVRQLRNNVERLMILASGDAEAEIDASMLPSEIGTLVPSTPNGTGGEKLMSLPLREAREVFEREYLTAQINRFGGNISRTAEFIGMERSALHRKLKSLGID